MTGAVQVKGIDFSQFDSKIRKFVISPSYITQVTCETHCWIVLIFRFPVNSNLHFAEMIKQPLT